MRLIPACVVVLLSASLPLAQAGEPGVKSPILIGMAETMLVDIAESERDILKKTISDLMKEFTGLQGELTIEKSIDDLASKLESKKLHLGVFQGVEFAWVQKKHPGLKPLMVSTSDEKEKRFLYAQVLVRKDSGIKDFEGLKGKSVAFPQKTREHVRIFVDRNGGKESFKAITVKSVETALDMLLTEKVNAVVADKNGVDFYAQRIRPGAFKTLDVVRTSEPFPAGVLVYNEGGLNEKTLARVQKGLRKANSSDRGQELMQKWGIVSFDAVPGEYQSDLDAILKAYPSPAGK